MRSKLLYDDQGEPTFAFNTVDIKILREMGMATHLSNANSGFDQRYLWNLARELEDILNNDEN